MSTDGELDRAGTGAEVADEPEAAAAHPSEPQELPAFVVVGGRIEPETPIEADISTPQKEAVEEDAEAALEIGVPSLVKAQVEEDAEAAFEIGVPSLVKAQVEEEIEAAFEIGVPSLVEAQADEDIEADYHTGTDASIRDVALLPLETVTHVFAPDSGLVAGPPPSGQLMVLTSRRLIAFCEAEGRTETHVVPTTAIKHVTVEARAHSNATLFQGIFMVICGIFVYLALGYWLTGQIDGPTIPVIHMDIAPLIALILVLTGGLVMVQVFLTRPMGAISFQGEGLRFSFPFRGEAAQRHVFDLANAAFRDRYAAGDRNDWEGEQFEEGDQLYHSAADGDRPSPGDERSAEG